MQRRLIIDGNAVYEIDEECIVKKQANKETVNESSSCKQEKGGEESSRKEKSPLKSKRNVV